MNSLPTIKAHDPHRAHWRNELSSLTRGAIKTMVDGGNDPNHVATATTTAGKSLKAPYIVLTYPYTFHVPGPTLTPNLDRVYISKDYIYIYDGEHYARVGLLDPAMEADPGANARGSPLDQIKTSISIIRINSYVTSYANLKQTEPIIFLTSISCSHLEILPYDLEWNPSDKSIVSGIAMKEKALLIPPGKRYERTEERVMGGIVGDFLIKVAPCLSYDSLSGLFNIPSTPYIPSPILVKYLQQMIFVGPPLLQLSNAKLTTEQQRYAEKSNQLKVICDFLTNHHAMDTLSKSTKYNSDVLPTNTISTATALPLQQLPSSISLHFSVLKSFALSQLERQKASITANNGRTNPTPTVVKIIKQNQDTLLEMIRPEFMIENPHAKDYITVDLLHYFHSKLCGNGLVSDAGKFRTRTVRVGTTSFVTNRKMDEIVGQLLLSLHQLRVRLPNTSVSQLRIKNQPPRQENTLPMSNQDGRTSEQRQLLASITYAAAVCMSILDTHPYSDGNGRLARLLLNYVLVHQVHVPFTIPLFATPAQRAEYTKAICKTRQQISLKPVGDVPDELLLESYEHSGALQPMVELILDRLYKAITEFNKLIDDKINTHSEEEEARSARMIRERTVQSGDCQICLDNAPNISSLCCGTSYHMSCLAQWLKSNSTCPKCRSAIPQLQNNRAPPTNGEISEMRRAVYLVRDTLNLSGNFHAFDDDTIEYGLLDAIQRQLDGDASEEMSEDANNTEDDTVMSGAPDETVDDDDTTEEPPNRQLECLHCTNLAARNCSNNCCSHCCREHGESHCHRHS